VRALWCCQCDNLRWVCEAHRDLPWGEGQRVCRCGAPGEPCPACNRVDGDTVPEMPDGFIPDLENEDWS